ncbi:MAG TPA: peptidylprolyl isomerase [Flavobacteriales bacterium]|nr:peptidylprolyl isomerase [Flavobacteriales bacterium]
MSTERGKSPVTAIADTAILMAAKQHATVTVGPYPSVNGSCALVRILDEATDQWARVNYIYLNKKSGSDDALHVRADSILSAIKGGWPFADAAAKCSMDGNGQQGGDLGWFARSMMVAEFRDVVFQHHKGDLFIARVDVYGWYVIEVTQEPGTYEVVEYVLGRGPICP